MKEILLGTIPEPTVFTDVAPTLLTDETMSERKNKLLQSMQQENFDLVAIYADKEHGSNFEYLTGFIPRFEEGLLLVESSGKCTVILGNENLKMAQFSRIPVELKHSPLFSLPNQPMDNEQPLELLLKELAIDTKKKIGLAGWKLFTSKHQNNQALFDLPYFIVSAFKEVKHPNAQLINGTHLFISGEAGVRTTNNANEIAHYEYGANLASSCMLKAMNAVEVGQTEAQLGELLTAEGQYNSVVTIAATGQRFEKANLYPTHKKLQLGDPLSMTTAFKGGLSSRTGFVIENQTQLPPEQKDYLERVVKPYYQAVVTWLETMKTGKLGKEIYHTIETVLPKADFHWYLNPGHLVADEEWLSSPIFADSTEMIRSGMIFQIDIIPSVAGYTGTSGEECVAIADADLQGEIKANYPELWARIVARRTYLTEVLRIDLSPEILPLSNTVGYIRPFFLAQTQALFCK